MGEIIQHLLDQPLANIVAVAGLAFLFVAAVGKIPGKIEPDTLGRIASAVIGVICVPGGLSLHYILDSKNTVPASKSSSVVASVSTSSLPKKTPPAAQGERCQAGYVWRLVVPRDHVCVTLAVQTQVETDNRLAPSRTNNGGRFGPDTCKQPFVWRDAVPGDHVCVLAETRRQAADDNAFAATRIAR